MHFGTGRHACPGRWFVGAEIEMIFGWLALEYNFMLEDGEGRPKNIIDQYQHMIDPMAEILFKKVEVLF